MNSQPCQCGEHFIAGSTSALIEGVRHRTDGPCFHYDGVDHEDMVYAPAVPQGLEYITFVRKPFTVEAVLITKENIRDCARYVGDLETKDDGSEYILVDRRKVPNVDKVYPGFFMTRMGDNVRCYSRKVFLEQFTEMTGDIKPWVEFMQGLGVSGG